MRQVMNQVQGKKRVLLYGKRVLFFIIIVSYKDCRKIDFLVCYSMYVNDLHNRKGKIFMADAGTIMSWTFYEETDIPREIHDILVDGEEAEVAYKTVRDVAVVTNKRIIVADRQGITGKKVEVYTIPFKSVIMYSSENGGMLDLNAELELWTKAGKFKLNLNKKVDIRKLDRLIGTHIL